MDTQRHSFGWVKPVSTALIAGLSFIFVLFLFLQSMFSSAYLNTYEQAGFIKDSPFLLFAAIAAVLGLFWLVRRFWGHIPAPGAHLLKLLTVVQLVLWALLVLHLQLAPRTDQAHVMDCAAALFWKTPGPWLKGEYCYVYPYENGISYLIYLLSYLVGTRNWLFVQLLNIPALLLCDIYTAKLVHRLFGDEALSRFTYLFLLFFLPINCYVTFVYGTLFGLCAALAGLYQVVVYLQRGRFWRVAAGGLLLAVGYVIKGNYLIFAIAAALLLLCNALYRRRAAFAAGAVLVVCLMFALSAATEAAIQTRLGLSTMGKMIPTNAYIVMGLQPGELGPGWYNGYTYNLYVETDFDRAATEKIAAKDLAELTGRMARDPAYTIDFFSKKIASQWNEATFQSFWLFQNRESAVVPAAWVWNALTEASPFCRVYRQGCNLFLSFLYLGVLLFLVFDFRQLDPNRLLFAILFLGGFLYLLVWEAKGQYTLCFVYLLIPLMLRGYQLLLRQLAALGKGEGPVLRQAAANTGVRALAVCLALLALTAVLPLRVLDRSIRLSGGDKAFSNLIEENWGNVRDGAYTIRTATDGKDLSLLLGGDLGPEPRSILLQGGALRIQDDRAYDLRLGLDGSMLESGSAAVVTHSSDRTTQIWHLNRLENGSCLIRAKSGLFLTYEADTGAVTLRDYSAGPNQEWLVEPAN